MNLSCKVVNGVASIGCVKDLLSNFINAALGLAGVVALILIIWGGISYITSAGNPDQVARARSTIMYAIIGLVVVLASFFIVNMTGRFIGVSK